ncbi:MAG: ABC transporter permease [Defluviitaleaceae bacterium]|nr:ABC transporter permease [Defluviitaleaceae bacterium]
MDESRSTYKKIVHSGYFKYYRKKTLWFLATLVAAVILNFVLPRLMPGDPLAAIMARLAPGIQDTEALRRIYEHYMVQFGLDRPVIQQFFIYVGNLFRGDLGLSFSRFPRPVSEIIMSAMPWTIGLQLPAIIVGWFIGNILGAIAAYSRNGFDRVLMPTALFVSGIPAFGMAIILLTVFGLNLGWFPIAGGYGIHLLPHLSWQFIGSIIYHYHLPFMSIVLIAIGGQALGMRSMSIYELNADYVRYSRFMGIKDRTIVRYIFRNAMLPQVTGLALSIGTMMGGALVAEIIFGYPGLGTTLLRAIREGDYPLISGITLVITIMVLIAVFLLEIIYGLIDPRVKAAQFE